MGNSSSTYYYPSSKSSYKDSQPCTCSESKDNCSTTSLLLVRVKKPSPMHHAIQVTYKCDSCGREFRKIYELFKDGKEAKWHYYAETEIKKVVRTSTRAFSYAHVQECFDAMWSTFHFLTANCGDWTQELWDMVFESADPDWEDI